MDQEFGKRLAERQAGWRSVVALAVQNGVAVPGMSTSLAYFDTYRRACGRGGGRKGWFACSCSRIGRGVLAALAARARSVWPGLASPAPARGSILG